MEKIDILIILVNLTLSIFLGIKFRGRQTDSRDYFSGGGSFDGGMGRILVGLSIAATLFSGISFLAYPSISYVNGFSVYTAILAVVPAYMLFRFWFVNRYLSCGYTQPYEGVEAYLGPRVRLLVSFTYILFRIGWLGTLIYVPTLAILASTGWSSSLFWPVVLVVGFTCTIYTAFGGLRGVVLTDALQFCIILVGVAATLYILGERLFDSGVALGPVIRANQERLNFDFSLNLFDDFSFWTVLIGLSMVNCATYMGDAMTLQRYMAIGKANYALRSFTINIIAAVSIILLLVTLGNGIFLYYCLYPDPVRPEVHDNILPYFCATELPAGISGLFISSILAATMSSITSGINTLSGTVMLDFGGHLGLKRLTWSPLFQARAITLLIGVLATLVSGLVAELGSIWVIVQTLGGLLLGPIFGIVAISTLRIRVNEPLIFSGTLLGVVAGFLVSMSEISAVLITVVTFGVTATVPLLLHFLIYFGKSRNA